jgi:hypothetical protein
MSGLIAGVGRIGAVGGARTVTPPPVAANPDFILTNASVVTQWDMVTVGQLLPVDAPAGSFFLLVEGTAASGDEAGLAVVNG